MIEIVVASKMETLLCIKDLEYIESRKLETASKQSNIKLNQNWNGKRI